MTHPHEPDACRRFDQFIKTQGLTDLYHRDAVFHATTQMMRLWLGQVEQVLADQGVPADVARRVLDQLIYGSVSPAEVYRIEYDQLHRDKLMKQALHP
jgi:hypothetical protein